MKLAFWTDAISFMYILLFVPLIYFPFFLWKCNNVVLHNVEANLVKLDLLGYIFYKFHIHFHF